MPPVVRRASLGDFLLDTSAAAAIIGPVPGRGGISGGRRRCLMTCIPLTWPRADRP